MKTRSRADHLLGIHAPRNEPFMWLASILAASSGIVVWSVVQIGPLSLVLTGVVVLALPILLLKWPSSAVSCLILASAVSRYTVELFGLTVKAEHVAVLLLGAITLVRIAATKKRAIMLDAPGRLVLVYIAVSLLSSAFNHPNHSLRLAGLISLVGSSYLVIINLVIDRCHLQAAYRALLGLTVLEAIFGIVCVVAYHAIGLNLGVQTAYHGSSGWISSPYGSFWEGNFFGQYCMIGALMLLTRLTYRNALVTTAKLSCSLIIALAALALSLTRGAWLGFIGGTLVLIALRIRHNRGFLFRNLLVLFLCAALTTALLAPFVRSGTDVGEIVRGRFATFGNIVHDPTVASRLANYDAAFRFWVKRPLLGWGTGGFERVFGAMYISPVSSVGNWMIHALFDTGAIGLCVFVAIVAKLVCDAARATRYARDAVSAKMLSSLLVSLVGLLIAGLATDATWLAFSWIHFGLVASAARMATHSHGSGPPVESVFGRSPATISAHDCQLPQDTDPYGEPHSQSGVQLDQERYAVTAIVSSEGPPTAAMHCRTSRPPACDASRGDYRACLSDTTRHAMAGRVAH